MSETMSNRRTHIPPGVADYFWRAARERRRLESLLLDTFRSWGYNDVIPPTFEYADTLTTHASLELQRALYRFLDHDGSTLALRPDMTIAVARLVGTRLHDVPMPQRFCYAGSVFRYNEPQAAQQREFVQLGYELVGAELPAADGEVLALTVKAMQVAGLHSLRLVVGQLRYFGGLLAELQLAGGAQQALQRAIQRRSEPELIHFLEQTQLTIAQKKAVSELLHLNDGDAAGVIDHAQRLSLNEEMQAAVDNLRAIYRSLQTYSVAHMVHLDLAEVHNLGYYTGITFSLFVPELGFGLAGGGRYDHMVGAFGPEYPAVGAALGLERILLARELQSRVRTPSTPPVPDAVVATNNSPVGYQIVEEWRSRGACIVIEVTNQLGAELWAQAHAKGIPRALTWTGAGFDVYDDPDALDQPSRHLAAADAHSFFISP